MSNYTTREEWLIAFTNRARPVFEAHGYKIPENVRVSVGFTSKGAKSNRIGECWSSQSSEDGAFEIFITPSIGNASRIADIHTHELIHATVGLEAGHKKPFVDCMKALGLEGKPTATTAGTKWHDWADPILEELGPLPHAALKSGGNGQKKQSTRMIKCECEFCGFIMRTSAQWIEAAAGLLLCPDPECRSPMMVA